jgi:hypothetical protein
MVFITLSIAVYCFALWHRRSVSLEHPSLHLDGRLLRRVALVACVACAVGLVFFLYRTGSFSSGELFAKRFNEIPGGAINRFFTFDYWLFKLISSVKYFFYGLLVYWIWRGETAGLKTYALIVATLILSLLVPSVVGSRAHVFIILLDLIVLLFLGLRRRRVVFLSLLIVISIGFTGSLAIARHTRPTNPSQLMENTRRALEGNRYAAAIAKARGGYERLDPERVERSLWFTRRVGDEAAKKIDRQLRGRYFLGLYKTAHIVDEVPDRVPFLYGQSFYGWLFVLVPSSVWPDKPIFAEMAPILAHDIFLEPTNNIPPGLVGEAWLNFGWLGLLAVAAVGALMGLAYNSFLHARNDATVQVLYAMLLTRCSFIMMNTSFGDAVLKLAVDAGPVLLLLLLARWSGLRRAERSDASSMSRLGRVEAE